MPGTTLQESESLQGKLHLSPQLHGANNVAFPSFGKEPLDEGVRSMGAELKGGVPTSVRIILCDRPALWV